MDIVKVFILLITLLALSFYGALCHADHPLLLLISFDGFRWDYLHKVKCDGRKTPNFDYLISNGVFVNDGVKNAYITKTFPNHYTIVTGLYEESHGVVANTMFDPVTGRNFSIGNQDDVQDPFWFDNGTDSYKGFPEPIWLTNQKPQGKFKRRTGVMFWPGSEVRGMTPFIYKHYDRELPFEVRVDNIVKWFSTETDPINLGLLYFSEPDHSGHIYGPNNNVIFDLIVELDGLVGYLIQRLKEVNLWHKMNIILTSDHGMAEVNSYVFMDEHVNSSLYTVINSGPVWNILPVEDQEETVYRQLTAVENVTVYKKDDIPTEYHYKHNRRVMPILVEAHEGFSIEKSKSDYLDKGEHGYNNRLSAMHPIFIAHGPVFKSNYTSAQFNNVDIYPLMCHILKVDPAPNNGSLENIAHILFVEDRWNISSVTFLLSVLFCACVTGVCCIAIVRIYVTTRRAWSRNSFPLVLESVKIDQKSALLESSSDAEDTTFD